LFTRGPTGIKQFQPNVDKTIDETQVMKNSFKHMYFDDLAVQDALVIIAIYALKIDTRLGSRENVRRIQDILAQYPVFFSAKADILKRIHKYWNAMQTAEPIKAVKMAAGTLIPNYREVAIEIATKVAAQNAIYPEESKVALDTIAAVLETDAVYR
jgi:hypothetical protein